jgi:hypothetical protein
MPEILTESFCERCGTRYTFESARPRVPLKGVKVLSRGLKNFVLSDGTTMDEAMAAARNETDRELTAHQLDAFHKTFNFCMSCRQYTCPNCWNEVEARCLTCAPHLGHEIMPAPFPDIAATSHLVANPTGAVETNGAYGANGSKGTLTEAGPVEAADTSTAADTSDDDFDYAARLEALTGATSRTEPSAPVEDERPIDATVSVGPAIEAAVQVDAIVEVEPAIEAGAAGEIAASAPVEPKLEAEAAAHLDPLAVPEVDAEPPTLDNASPSPSLNERIGVQTGGLLRRFRPGQDLDAELEAYERQQEALAAPPATEEPPSVVEAQAGEPEAIAEPEAEVFAETEVIAEVVAEPEVFAESEVIAEPEQVAQSEVFAETEAVAAEPALVAVEPEVAAQAEAVAAEPEHVAPPEPAAVEPVVAAQAEPAAAPERPVVHDVVAQPTWRMVAPDPNANVPVEPAETIPAAATSADPAAEPQWPARPEWLGATPSTGLPFLGRPAAAQGGLEALWAESNREVVATPGVPGRQSARSGIQPCISCGLSLSATARFCRRCGTPQAS